MLDEVILDRVKNYVIDCFRSDFPEYLYYHNLRHTQKVVEHSIEISEYYNLDENKKYILLTAAWFHDIGYLYAKFQNHEIKSVELVQAFLRTECSGQVLDEIKNTILATRYPTRPNSLIEEIICDTDTYHFGTPKFLITDELIKKEIESSRGISVHEWKRLSHDLLKSHRFYTSYCKSLLDNGKSGNMRILESQL